MPLPPGPRARPAGRGQSRSDLVAAQGHGVQLRKFNTYSFSFSTRPRLLINAVAAAAAD